MELSTEQSYFISEALKGQNILVDACIGSGKTTSIQQLCNLMDKNKKILYLTYNKLLKLDAKDKIKAYNTKVYNYHGLAFWLLKQNNISCGQAELISTFLSSNVSIPHYDVIIIDEYQDIDLEISQMLTRIKNANPNAQLIAVGDFDQKIYDFTSLQAKKFISDFLDEYTKCYFTICFRLNERIAYEIGEAWGKTIKGINSSMKVNELTDLNEIVENIASHEPHEILCLGSRTGVMSEILNLLEEKYPSKFNKNTVYASIRDNDGFINPQSNNAIFTTFDGSKGLEKPYCYIFDFDDAYWITRSHKANTDKTILKNIFLVAASRGKKEINFCPVNYKNEPIKRMPFEALALITNAHNNTYNEPFDVSEMYDFVFTEDKNKLYKMLDIKEIPLNDQEIFDFKNSDGLIDLSPVLGIWQEAIFFNQYDVWKEIENYKDLHPNKPIMCRYNDTVQKKVLGLVASQTNQNRYIKQVSENFITKFEEEQIKSRLNTIFLPEETVELPCYISFVNKATEQEIKINGRIDVLKDGIPYELKFKTELEDSNFLQIATYILSIQTEYGILWNTKTNKMYEIRIKDRDKFAKQMAITISKGHIRRINDIKLNGSLIERETKARKQRDSERIKKLAERKKERISENNNISF